MSEILFLFFSFAGLDQKPLPYVQQLGSVRPWLANI